MPFKPLALAALMYLSEFDMLILKIRCCITSKGLIIVHITMVSRVALFPPLQTCSLVLMNGEVSH